RITGESGSGRATTSGHVELHRCVLVCGPRRGSGHSADPYSAPAQARGSEGGTLRADILRDFLCLFFLVFLQAGCTVGPTYHPPKGAVPSSYSELHPEIP